MKDDYNVYRIISNAILIKTRALKPPPHIINHQISQAKYFRTAFSVNLLIATVVLIKNI